MTFPSSPVREMLAALLLLAGTFFAVRGTRVLAAGLAHAGSLDVIRGLRAWTIALSMMAFAVGVLSAQAGFLVLGGVFLAEELYETGVVALLIRAGAASAPSID